MIILIGTLTLNAQDVSYNFNSIDIGDVTINNLQLLGKDKSVLIQNFGQPQSISKEYWEMLYDTAYVYHYNGVVFYVLKNLVHSFDISTNGYRLTSDNIQIGDNIDRLKALYPISYENKKGNSVFLNIQGYDSYIEIEVDSNNIITKIYMGDY